MPARRKGARVGFNLPDSLSGQPPILVHPERRSPSPRVEASPRPVPSSRLCQGPEPGDELTGGFKRLKVESSPRVELSSRVESSPRPVPSPRLRKRSETLRESEERGETRRRWEESTERAEKEAEVLRMLHRTHLVSQVGCRPVEGTQASVEQASFDSLPKPADHGMQAPGEQRKLHTSGGRPARDRARAGEQR